MGSAHVKAVHKTLMKATRSLYFSNILRAAFTCADPKSAKKYSQVFFALLGSASVKVARSKLLVKSLFQQLLKHKN